MNDTSSAPNRPAPSLPAAMRAARADDAERSEAIVDLRTIALTRLAVLRDALVPVLAQVPEEIDIFDVGIMPGDPPRLFIDMIAFVEMGRDRRGFRFFQDRRHGRILLAESETLDGMVDAITAYIARRLIERERALASEPESVEPNPHIPVMDAGRSPLETTPDHVPSRRSSLYWLGQGIWFVVEVIGLLGLFGLLFLGVRCLMLSRHVWISLLQG
jgi:hypothetical protein